ncbi:MAG: type 1 glutamine amidotransferase domain-containing protein [Fibrobacterota bacterium]
MAKIAVILDNLFEDPEYTEPVKAYKESGHQITNIGLKKTEVKGKRNGTEVMIEQTLDETDPADFDALLIPGGYSPDKLRASETAVRFVKEFSETGKPVFSICHGPQLLITAGALKNRKITGYKSIIKDIENAGAEFIDEKVVVGGNFVSSRNPGDLPAFTEKTLEVLNGL